MRRILLGRGERATARIDVTNFIDIVLILLIFLVATSTFVTESSVGIDRPRAARAEDVAGAYVTVAITAAGSVSCAGQPVAVASLPDAVARAMRERAASRVVVLSDRQAQVGLTLRVMDLCRDGGARRVDLAAEHGNGSEP
jgi:biopolymer transport protein ExbD